MGLLDFIGDMETASKLSKQYGLGAANAFLDMRSQQEAMKEAQTQYRQSGESRSTNAYDETEIKQAIKKLQFQMTNYLRTTNVPYEEYEKKRLKGIIEQVEYVYNQESADIITHEWNEMCFEKEFNF